MIQNFFNFEWVIKYVIKNLSFIMLMIKIANFFSFLILKLNLYNLIYLQANMLMIYLTVKKI